MFCSCVRKAGFSLWVQSLCFHNHVGRVPPPTPERPGRHLNAAICALPVVPMVLFRGAAFPDTGFERLCVITKGALKPSLTSYRFLQVSQIGFTWTHDIF